MKKFIIPLIIAIPIAAILGFHFFGDTFGSVALNQRRNFKEIGTSSAPLTLTNSFGDATAVSSTPLDIQGLNKMVIGGTYVTKAPGSILSIGVQQSMDGGTTYYGYSIAKDVPSYGNLQAGLNSNVSSTFLVVGATGTAMGVPFTISDVTVSSGTTISFRTPPISILGDKIKIFFQESVTGTHGTLHSQVFLTN